LPTDWEQYEEEFIKQIPDILVSIARFVRNGKVEPEAMRMRPEQVLAALDVAEKEPRSN
jgi:hypothetical protein